MRDFQQSRLYRWEQAILRSLRPVGTEGGAVRAADDLMELAPAADLCARMAADYGVAAPKHVVYVDKLSAGLVGHYVNGTDTITVVAGKAHRSVVVHEMVHCLIGRLFPGIVSSHGPEFAGIYVHCLQTYVAPLDEKALVESVRKHKLLVTKPDLCRPDRVRDMQPELRAAYDEKYKDGKANQTNRQVYHLLLVDPRRERRIEHKIRGALG